MTEEMKLKMFEKAYELDKYASVETYDGHNYAEQVEGAFLMLDALGLGTEYVRWSYDKWLSEQP